MNLLDRRLSRRDFLKTGIFAAGFLTLKPWESLNHLQAQWPDAEQLGRNCTGGTITLRAHPSANATEISKVYEDTVVVWLREVVGEAPSGVYSRRWVETPNGYLFAPVVQPVRNLPNAPIILAPNSSAGQGFWAEVTVPYVDIKVEKDPCSFWLRNVKNPRLYYSQVLWIDAISTNDQGQVSYRVNEKYGNCGDTYWGAAEAFRPLTAEEIAPIHPDAADKRVYVDLNHQTLSCFEGKDEVYFCRISSGAKYDAQGRSVDKYSTPIGQHLPWEKDISTHMAGGSIGTGYDTPGISWTTLFDPQGAAIHSTFWHNDFGTPRSHGCVNARPEDAKWVFRWGLPSVVLDPGRVSISGPGGTIVEVVDQTVS